MISQAWRAMGPLARTVVAIVVLVVGLNLLVAGVTVATGGSGPGGPASSSFATGTDGLAAYAELLAGHGHPVERLRVPLDRAGLDPGTTLVLAEPSELTDAAGRALADFVAGGGRLLAAGAGAESVLAALPEGGPRWDDARVGTAGPLVPVPEVAGVTTVVTGGDGAWAEPGATLPVLAGPGGVLVTVASVGRGRVVALADASLLQNRLLAEADNAAFALAAAGEGRPVVFAEAHHGYGRRTGLGAVPVRWRWALAGGVMAALVWMWSQGRRLGPPDEIERTAPPARRAYVDAMAGALARARQPGEVVAPLQDRARRRLAERVGPAGEASDVDLRDAATGLGLSDDEVDALFRPARTEADVLAVGRAMARIGGRRP